MGTLRLRLSWGLALDEGGIATDKLIGGAATTTYYIDELFIDKLFYLRCHRCWCLIIFTHRIRQTSIGMG